MRCHFHWSLLCVASPKTSREKYNMSSLSLALLSMIILSTTQGEGNRWKLVRRGSVITNTLTNSPVEVKTIPIANLDGRCLAIEFCSGECSEETLERFEVDFITTEGGMYFHFNIKHGGVTTTGETAVSSKELVWTFQPMVLFQSIFITCNQKTCSEVFLLENIVKIDRFRFGSEDTASLSYRVNSTDESTTIDPGSNINS